jgi:hypothetical protein
MRSSGCTPPVPPETCCESLDGTLAPTKALTVRLLLIARHDLRPEWQRGLRHRLLRDPLLEHLFVESLGDVCTDAPDLDGHPKLQPLSDGHADRSVLGADLGRERRPPVFRYQCLPCRPLTGQRASFARSLKDALTPSTCTIHDAPRPATRPFRAGTRDATVTAGQRWTARSGGGGGSERELPAGRPPLLPLLPDRRLHLSSLLIPRRPSELSASSPRLLSRSLFLPR